MSKKKESCASVKIFVQDGQPPEEHEIGKDGVNELFEVDDVFPCVAVVRDNAVFTYNGFRFITKEIVNKGLKSF